MALWVDEREDIARFCCEHLGMHVIEKTDAFTLVGVAPSSASSPYVDVRASAIAEATSVHREDGCVLFEMPGGIPVALVERPGAEFDLDHVVLRLPDRDSAAIELESMGFERREESLAIAERELHIRTRWLAAAAQPHRALVDSAAACNVTPSDAELKSMLGRAAHPFIAIQRRGAAARAFVIDGVLVPGPTAAATCLARVRRPWATAHAGVRSHQRQHLAPEVPVLWPAVQRQPRVPR